MENSNPRPPTWLIVVLALQGFQAIFPIIALVLLAFEPELDIRPGEALVLSAPLVVVAIAASVSWRLWTKGNPRLSKVVAFVPLLLAIASYFLLEFS